MQFGTVHTICGHCGKLAYTSTGFCELCGSSTEPRAVQAPAGESIFHLPVMDFTKYTHIPKAA